MAVLKRLRPLWNWDYRKRELTIEIDILRQSNNWLSNLWLNYWSLNCWLCAEKKIQMIFRANSKSFHKNTPATWRKKLEKMIIFAIYQSWKALISLTRETKVAVVSFSTHQIKKSFAQTCCVADLISLLKKCSHRLEAPYSHWPKNKRTELLRKLKREESIMKWTIDK